MRRRSLLAGLGTLGASAIGGCTAVVSVPSPALVGLVFRTETGQTEPVAVLFEYTAYNDYPEHSSDCYEIERDQATVVPVDRGAGYYSVRATAKQYDTEETREFSSFGTDGVSSDVRFEFVVESDGTLSSRRVPVRA